MNPDGTDQTLLTHGSSADCSPDSKHIAFHASALTSPPGINLFPHWGELRLMSE